MRFLSAAIAVGVLTLSVPAFAQSGYDTGSGQSSGSTTNSGSARPDATSNRAAGSVEEPSGAAGPTTSSSGASGERGARPDAKPANMPSNTGTVGAGGRAAPTQTDN